MSITRPAADADQRPNLQSASTAAKQPWQALQLILGQIDATRNGGGHHGDYTTNTSVSTNASNIDVYAPF